MVYKSFKSSAEKLFMTKGIFKPDTEAEGINDPETIAREKAQYGYKSEDRIYTGTLIGADRATLNSLKQFVIKGEINYQTMMSGDAVILVTRNKNPTAKTGDNLTLTQVIRPDSPNSKDKSDRFQAVWITSSDYQCIY